MTGRSQQRAREAFVSFLSGLVPDPAKLRAFVRRDLLVAWSYRLAYLQDALGLLFQVLMFYFVSRLVDPSRVPGLDGTESSYLAFVTIGIAIAGFIQVALVQVMTQVRNEQLMGTLEVLLMTPTSVSTLQLGLVIYDLVYVPVRTAVFLLLVTTILDVDLRLTGLVPATAVLLAFIPFVWGIGIALAAAVLTFRRGAGFVGLAASALSIGSGAYFPLQLFPEALSRVAEASPIAIALTSIRELLLEGAGWADAGGVILVLVPASALSLVLGHVAFRVALHHERRLGTLGLY